MWNVTGLYDSTINVDFFMDVVWCNWDLHIMFVEKFKEMVEFTVLKICAWIRQAIRINFNVWMDVWISNG